MGREIDEKVVEMQFDNRQFERNVSTTMSTLDKLKALLRFDGASKGFDQIQAASGKVTLSPLSTAVETVSLKFNAMYTVADQVLRNITNSAMHAGKQIVSALTIDPIKTGFQEYETQINAVQTILANTQSKGSTLSDVNAALDQLNKYADQTIYNFTEMTRNIGTFTAAGVDLDKSVTSIKGIANLAAVSGSSAQQASTAMYQLSQALAAGRVSLMDWNSVVNAGMGGQVFQEALKRTATQMGTNVDALIKKYGSFRESLTEGQWLTAEVLTETLTQLSGAYTEADLIAQGYSEEQAKQITELAETAVNAATKVKTFTQLWDTLKEAAQSGWTETWEILVGDFEEAKEFLTELSETFGEFIQKSADARNDLLYDAMTSNWKKITDGITEAGLSAEDFKDNVTAIAKEQKIDVDSIVKEYGSLEKAFKNGALSSDLLNQALVKMTGSSEDISKKMTELQGKYKTNADLLKALTDAGNSEADIQDLITKNTQGQTIALNDLSDAQLMSIGYTSEQIQSIRNLSKYSELLNGSLSKFIDNVAVQNGREMLLDTIRVSLRSLISVFEAAGKAWREVFPPMTSDQLLGIVKSIRDFAMNLRPSEETLDKLQRTFRGLFSVLSIVKQGITAILSPIGRMFGQLTGLTGGILDLTASFGDWLFAIDQGIKAGGSFADAGNGVSSVLDKIAEGIRYIFSNIGKLGDVFRSVGTGIGNVFGSVFDILSDVTNWISNNLSSFDIFAGLAGGGIFILAKKLSGFVDNIVDSLKGLLDIFKGGEDKVGFRDVLSSIHDSLESFQQGIKVASLVGIATAVMLLSSALRTISQIEPAKIAYSLVAIQAMVMILNGGFKSLTKTLKSFNAKGTIKASVAMIAMATAINILGDAMTKIAKLSLSELAKGLVGISVSITVLSSAMKRISGSNITLRTSVAMLALAKSCEMLATALGGFAVLSWGEIARGLTAMSGALVIFTGVLKVISKSSGTGSLAGATAILIASQSLGTISENLKKLGALNWGTIGRGLAAMGGALVAFTAALSVLSKFGGFGAILGGTAILIASQSLGAISDNLKKLGDLSWDRIGKGLTAMGTALGELTIVLSVLSKIGGFGSILGATAILIATQSLNDISENLKKLGLLSWKTIARGLTAMGGALGELTAVLGILGKLGGFGAILGGTSLLIAAQSLGDIADALAKFGSYDWTTIGHGLVAMGGALAELGVINGVLGKLGGFSSIIGSASILIVAQALEPVAEALQKFGSMSWSEIGRGLTAMGGALAEVAIIGGVLGTLTNVFGILGSTSLLIGIQGLNDLAEALQKFGSMSWDEIGRGLSAMGGALGELALGGFLNTFALLGNIAISEISVSLGDLADSVKKWKDVVVPDGLAANLSSLAGGVNAFMFAGWGADAIATVAAPLGAMADSVKKWEGVVVPENIGTNLESLATGVKSFTFGGWGADALSTAAPGIGDMADAVKKWKDVIIPPDLETGLTGIANGVKAFNFAFLGSWTIGDLVTPLGNLSDAVKKWQGVTLPENMSENLKSLADGVKAFGFAFVGGWSIGSIVEPLTNLADAVRKWDGINISGLGTELTNLSNGLGSLVNVDLSSKFVRNFGALFETIGTTLGQNLATGFSSQSVTFNTAVVTMLTNGVNQVTQRYAQFKMVGQNLMLMFVNGAKVHAVMLGPVFTTVLSSTLSQIQAQYPNFYNAGGYLASGFANGISAYTYLVEAKAAAMANAAYNSAMRAMDAHSPSRLFKKAGTYVPMGFANGIVDRIKDVESSAKTMTNAAIDSVKSTISNISQLIEGSIDSQPTIRPVVDLSDVKAGIGTLDTMFSQTQAVGVNSAINRSRAAASEIQNGSASVSSGSVYQFTQNNYSPKALSNIEIYRQTRNLFSSVERTVKA